MTAFGCIAARRLDYLFATRCRRYHARNSFLLRRTLNVGIDAGVVLGGR